MEPTAGLVEFLAGLELEHIPASAIHAARPLPERNLNEIIRMVYNLENFPDLSHFLSLLDGTRELEGKT